MKDEIAKTLVALRLSELKAKRHQAIRSGQYETAHKLLIEIRALENEQS